MNNIWGYSDEFCIFAQGGASAGILDYCLAHSNFGRVLFNSSTTISVRILNEQKLTLAAENSNWVQASDERLKDVQGPIENAL